MAAVTIQSVKARQIFDSRGNPTVEVQINPLCPRISTICVMFFLPISYCTTLF